MTLKSVLPYAGSRPALRGPFIPTLKAGLKLLWVRQVLPPWLQPSSAPHLYAAISEAPYAHHRPQQPTSSEMQYRGDQTQKNEIMLIIYKSHLFLTEVIHLADLTILPSLPKERRFLPDSESPSVGSCCWPNSTRAHFTANPGLAGPLGTRQIWYSNARTWLSLLQRRHGTAHPLSRSRP